MRKEIPPHSPPYHNKDRLFHHDLKKGQARHATQIMPDHLHQGQARHATQIRPIYDWDRIGHGEADPLMKASMDYWRDVVAHHDQEENHHEPGDYDKEINLKGKGGSPLCYGINDIVHIDKDTIMSFPCLPAEDDEGELQQEASTSESYLQEHGSPLSGLGFSDIVHVDKNTILSIPCLPFVEDDNQETEKSQEIHQEHHFQDILGRIRIYQEPEQKEVIHQDHHFQDPLARIRK
jgi:hypothetical protein